MENIDRVGWTVLSNELKEAMEKIAEKHGLQSLAKGGTFSGLGERADFKIEFSVPNHEAIKSAAIELGAEFEIGFTWKDKNKTFEVTGFDPKRKKNVVVAKCNNGKDYVFPISTVNYYHHVATRTSAELKEGKINFGTTSTVQNTGALPETTK